METTSYIALSRQGALRREMDVIAHNLANMNTTAFKGERMMFVEHIVQSPNDNSFLPTRLAFTRDVAQFRNLSEGPIRETGDPLHVAIRGEGFFVVEMPDGSPRYTRNGNFTTDTEGQLVTQGGRPVLSRGGAPIFFSPQDTAITISGDGTVSTNNGPLGQLRVVRFEEEQNLELEGSGLMKTDDPPEDMERPHVLQGTLESSNIQPVIELSQMIQVQRSYESVKAFIEAEDQRQRKMIENLGGRA
jgi:flagellar basal-body rod protein FlgF